MVHPACPRDNRRVKPDRSEAAALGALARVVRRRRQESGLTQEDAAHDADLSVRHYQSLESGTLNPSFGVILRVCRALRVAPHDLIREFEAEAGRKRSSKG